MNGSIGMRPRQRRASGRAFARVAAAAWMFALPALAQQPQSATREPSPVNDSQAAQQTPESSTDQDQARSQGQDAAKHDRILGVFPNYGTVRSGAKVAPLSAKDKFKLSARIMVDPYTFLWVGVDAALGQAENTEPAYGQGFEGYAKRYGTSYADTGIGSLMATSVFPALLRQDPRYFQLGTGGTFHRTGYSLSRVFVTRGDSGGREFNYGEIAGKAVAAGIANAYHPSQQRSISNTMRIWGVGILWDAAGNMAKEFWPDIRRHFRKKNRS